MAGRAPIKVALPHRVAATSLARFSIWIYGTFGLVQGVLILASDIRRWGSPGFVTIMAVPGAPDVWGYFALGFGVLTIGGSIMRQFWPKTIGVLGIAVWAGAFASGAATATIQNDTAGVTGGPAYYTIALASSVLMFVDERRQHA